MVTAISLSVERAYQFATAAHEAVGQRRKYTNEPYIGHPVAVATIVAKVDHTEAMLMAALLHDTVEDTLVTLGDLESEFGPEVAELVGWLTDVSRAADGNRACRKALDLAHSAQAPAAAQTIKLADLLDNTSSIVAYDPAFARVYLREMEALLGVLTKGDGVLHVRATNLLQQAKQQIAASSGCGVPPKREAFGGAERLSGAQGS
jgi:(p)ppGpp synthase/HD superfamily hydrolase